MTNIACGIEYDGTDYHGFQRQPGTHGPTVQAAVETAIARISGAVSVVNGAGRTDAGVHASGQVVNFHTSSHLAPQVWVRALNAVLPADIAVRWANEVPERFHARFSARSRSYRYTIWNDAAPTALHARYSYYRPQALAVDLMHEACQVLVGRKDFGAFGRSPEETNPRKPGPHSCIRRIVGTLLLVGQKRLSLDEFATIVQRAEKTHLGSAAPSHGLCLVQVNYPEEFGVRNEEDI